MSKKFMYATDRYAIMTSDRKRILVGRAREYHFAKIGEIGNEQINTFFSEQKAKASFERSWSQDEGHSLWDDFVIVKLHVSYNESLTRAPNYYHNKDFIYWFNHYSKNKNNEELEKHYWNNFYNYELGDNGVSEMQKRDYDIADIQDRKSVV